MTSYPCNKYEQITPSYRLSVKYLCGASAMLGRTPSDVLSESKKLLVLVSNKLFPAGDIFFFSSGGLKIETFYRNFRFN